MYNIANASEKMLNYVTNEIATNYHFGKKEAKNMVQNSAFMIMLKEEPDFVFHYNVEYWAKEIINEHTLN